MSDSEMSDSEMSDSEISDSEFSDSELSFWGAGPRQLFFNVLDINYHLNAIS